MVSTPSWFFELTRRSHLKVAEVLAPSSMILLGSGLFGLTGFLRRGFKEFENYRNANHSLKNGDDLKGYEFGTISAIFLDLPP